MADIKLSKGAAHWGYSFLNNSKGSLENLWASGSLAKKLKAAKNNPQPKKDENGDDYLARSDAWFDEEFPAFEVGQEERDYMRSILKELAGKKDLPANMHVAELAMAFELDKP